HPNGLFDSAKTMEIAISLPLRNREALTNLIHDQSDPNSQNYHHYLTPAQFTDLFGPTKKQYQQVIDFAAAHHLEIVHKHANRLVLTVRGKAADIENAFQVTLRTYQHPTENRTFFAPDKDPVVDASLPIYQVSGLNNYSIPHADSHLKTLVPMPDGKTKVKAKAASPNVGSGPQGSYQGNDFRRAYIPGTTLTGAGQNVALVQFDGFFASDIAAYEAQIGLTGKVPNVVVVPVDGGVPVPGPGVDEVSLDIEMVLSMAPGVDNIYVYEAPLAAPWEDMLNAIADDNLAKQVSSSWGGGTFNPDLAAEQIFQQMAVQGQTYFNASGDSDAFLGVVPFPSDSPNVTSVGGTTLTTDSGSTYNSETVWNFTPSASPPEGSSGGISPFFAIPSWQTNISMTTRGGSNSKRDFPDVALTGDNVFVIFGNGQAGIFVGTSCASPLWGGFAALINEQAALNGQPPVGFLNPALYGIATNASLYSTCFHDVTTGGNTWGGSPNLFFAARGYDLCTGLASPNGTNWINALLALNTPVTHISPPPPPYGTTMASVSGGNPNGAWELFFQDDAPISGGIVGNGWILSLTTADTIGTSGDN